MSILEKQYELGKFVPNENYREILVKTMNKYGSVYELEKSKLYCFLVGSKKIFWKKKIFFFSI